MSDSHWTNQIEGYWESEINQEQIRIEQGDIRAKDIRSILLCLEEDELYDSMIPMLKKMLNIECVSIQCQDSTTVEQVDKIVQVVSGLEKVREIELDVTLNNPIGILSWVPLVQIIQLSLKINMGEQNLSIEPIFKAIEGYPDLSSLTLEFYYQQMSSLSILFQEMIEGINPNVIRVSMLSVLFAGFPDVLGDYIGNLGRSLALIQTVKDLSIRFASTQINLKGCEEFLLNLAHSKLLLKKLSLGMNCFPQQSTIKIFGRLFENQLLLESFEIENFQFRTQLFQLFLKHQEVLEKLSSLSYDFEGNKELAFEDGMVSLAHFFSISKANLTTINISFDKSMFSGDSILEFGRTLASLAYLINLRMEFTGQLKDCSIVEFSETIASCNALEFLFIKFVDFGQKYEVQEQSEVKGKSIFEREKISIYYIPDSRRYFYKEGKFHFLVVETAIAKKMKQNVKRLKLNYPKMPDFPSKIENAIRTNLEEVVSMQNGLTALKYSEIRSDGKGFSVHIMNLIERNASTLSSLKVSTTISLPVMNILKEKAKENLVQFQFSNLDGKYDVESVVRDFPNLIDFFLKDGFYVRQSFWTTLYRYPSYLIQTDLNSFDISSKDRYGFLITNERGGIGMGSVTRNLTLKYNIVKECLEMRKITILSIILFMRIIYGNLTYKPQFMVTELWIDQ